MCAPRTKSGRTAIFFGFQNPSPIEDDIGLVEILHTLGARFMQLTYNNQSLLATGCYEAEDTGITRMGKQVIKEMNRVGLVVDMSHSADRSTIEAADISERPIAITHANPHSWAPALRNKSDDVIRAVTENGGMMGFSLYPHHLKDKSDCTLESFCEMIADRRRTLWGGTSRHRQRSVPGSTRQHRRMDARRAAGPRKSTMAKARPRPPASRRMPTGSATTAISATSKPVCAPSGSMTPKSPA